MDKLNYKKTVLANGLRIITAPMKNTNTITSMVFVKTGSRYEPKEENGISHVLEHLFFSGTKRRPTKSGISRELDRVGAISNAFTGHERTAYFVKADAKHLDLSLDILSDMYLNSIFTPQAIESERRVVVEEINMNLDNPARQIWDNFQELLYPNSPLGWDIAGPKETVLSLKRPQFFDYVKKHYHASNTVIVVAGNIEHESTLRKIRHYFKKVSIGSAPGYMPFTDTQIKPAFSVAFKKIDQAHIVIGVKTIPDKDPREYAFDVASTILGGGMSSRLFDRIRNKLGLAYYVGADTSVFQDTGHFAVYAGLNLKKVDLGIRAILHELKTIRDKKISARELEDAKTHMEGILSLRLESSNAIAQMLGNLELMRNSIETPEEYLRHIRKVTAADVQSIMREFLRTERLNFAVIGPFKDKTRFAKILKLD